MSFRSRTRILACILPGGGSRGKKLEDDTACCSRNLLEEADDDFKTYKYNLSTHNDDEDGGGTRKSNNKEDSARGSKSSSSTHKHSQNNMDNRHNDGAGAHHHGAHSPTFLAAPTMTMTASDSCSYSSSSNNDDDNDNDPNNSWVNLMSNSFGELQLDNVEQDGSIISASTITGCSLRSTPTPTSMSAPNSPLPSIQSASSMFTNSPSALSNCSSSPRSYSYYNSQSYSQSQPNTPSQILPRRPLTSPIPPRSGSKPKHRRSLSQSSTGTASSTSSLLMPLTLPAPPEPCPQVQQTLTLLKSIKQQIKAMKRRESRLSSQLHVQRRERQQMQEQIASLEARRLRVEAMFVRPLPLVLLLPVRNNHNMSGSGMNHSSSYNSNDNDEYDLCLLSEGNDAWNALPSPLVRIQLVQSPSATGMSIGRRSRGAALLVHFGPTLTQPMAAAVSFVQHPANDPLLQPTLFLTNNTNNAQDTTTTDLVDMDLQPLVQRRDAAFWERVTCGRVLEADKVNQLEDSSCKFLFDALFRDLQHLWRDQLTQVVDKNTRRIQWILPQEADNLYYDAIPASSSSATASSAPSYLALPPTAPPSPRALSLPPTAPPSPRALSLPPTAPPQMPLASSLSSSSSSSTEQHFEQQQIVAL